MKIERLELLQQLFEENYCNDSKNMEKALKALRDNDVTQMQSIKILISSLKLSLKEADSIVRNSKFWLDRKEDTDKVRNGFWDALKKFGN